MVRGAGVTTWVIRARLAGSGKAPSNSAVMVRGLSAADAAQLEKQSVVAELLARRGSFAKPTDVLAKVPPRQEAPWLFLVVGSTPPRPPQAGYLTPCQAWTLTRNGVPGTRSKDLREIQELWRKTGFQYHGEAGVLPDAEGAKLAVKRYMEFGFAKEHPRAALLGAGKTAP